MSDFITKANPDEEFNNGGSTLGKSGGAPIDGPQSVLSQTDQNDTIQSLASANIGSYQQTNISSATPPSANPGRNEDANGNCLGAMTRGSSSFRANALTITLEDANGNYSPVAFIVGQAHCDCYVPLNVPLISLVGKLAKAKKLPSFISDLFGQNRQFEALLKYLGLWDNYTNNVRNKLNSLYPWQRLQSQIDSMRKVINALWVSVADMKKAIARTQARINYINKRINQFLANIAANTKARDAAVVLRDQISTLIQAKSATRDALHLKLIQGIATPSEQALYYTIINSDLPRLQASYRNQLQKISNYNNRIISDSNEISGTFKLDFQKNVAQADLAAQNATLNKLRDDINEELDDIEAIKPLRDQYRSQWFQYLKDSKFSDIFDIVTSMIGVGFDVLAALDPSRPKACFGPGTILNRDTCACECDTNHYDCAGTQGKAPLWSIVDIVAPVQVDELKRCYPDCGCNLTRNNHPLITAINGFCECDGCESGYTWKSGFGCACSKAVLSGGSIRAGTATVARQMGTCIRDGVIAAEEGLGKTWDPETCSWKCPAGSDVAEGRSCGWLYGRLQDNLGGVAPTKQHYLYRTGCNCVCDGRDELASGTLAEFPPACQSGYVFNSDPTVCSCVPCLVECVGGLAYLGQGGGEFCPDGSYASPSNGESFPLFTNGSLYLFVDCIPDHPFECTWIISSVHPKSLARNNDSMLEPTPDIMFSFHSVIDDSYWIIPNNEDFYFDAIEINSVLFCGAALSSVPNP
jgi:predicted  nucleic acid-binding Zn-ribbon protein